MIRKVLSLLAVFSVALLAQAAHAQLGVYGMFTVNRLSVPTYSTTGVAGPEIKSSVDPIGGTFGVYYDVRTYGPVRLGVDVRGVDTTSKQEGISNFNGSGTRIYSFLGGVRGSFHTPVEAIQPYVQMSAGLARTDHGASNTQTATGAPLPLSNDAEFHAYAGLDVHLFPLLDFRAIELGYGGITGGTNGVSSVKSLSTGFVLRFGR